MSIADTINSFFELGGAVLCAVNVAKLLKDKSVKGVYWPVAIFWSAWGFWNIYYYAALQQPVSFVAGLMLTLSNSVWLTLAAYYAAYPSDNSSH